MKYDTPYIGAPRVSSRRSAGCGHSTQCAERCNTARPGRATRASRNVSAVATEMAPATPGRPASACTSACGRGGAARRASRPTATPPRRYGLRRRHGPAQISGPCANPTASGVRRPCGLRRHALRGPCGLRPPHGLGPADIPWPGATYGDPMCCGDAIACGDSAAAPPPEAHTWANRGSRPPLACGDAMAGGDTMPGGDFMPCGMARGDITRCTDVTTLGGLRRASLAPSAACDVVMACGDVMTAADRMVCDGLRRLGGLAASGDLASCCNLQPDPRPAGTPSAASNWRAHRRAVTLKRAGVAPGGLASCGRPIACNVVGEGSRVGAATPQRPPQARPSVGVEPMASTHQAAPEQAQSNGHFAPWRMRRSTRPGARESLLCQSVFSQHIAKVISSQCRACRKPTSVRTWQPRRPKQTAPGLPQPRRALAPRRRSSVDAPGARHREAGGDPPAPAHYDAVCNCLGGRPIPRCNDACRMQRPEANESELNRENVRPTANRCDSLCCATCLRPPRCSEPQRPPTHLSVRGVSAPTP